MHKFKVQIYTKNRGLIETIISAHSIGQARLLAQEQHPNASIGCIIQAD